MKLNVNNVNKFMEVIKTCKDPVYLTDWEVDENGNYNLQLNLKSTLSMYIGIAQLLGDHGDWFEIHASNYEDEVLLMEFMKEKINYGVLASDNLL